MPTCEFFLPAWSKKMRSPRRRSERRTGREVRRCCSVLCGTETPACLKLNCTRPLQSNPAEGDAPPKWYGRPSIFAAWLAARSAADSLTGVEDLASERGALPQAASTAARRQTAKVFRKAVTDPTLARTSPPRPDGCHGLGSDPDFALRCMCARGFADWADGADLDAADACRRDLGGELDCFVQVARFDEVEAGEVFLGLGE